eukprot:TRINITY_DN7920_c0_g1_i1.p1 TRINITY_DN7920_c0_g1~~TRINITY_DN7920_c0_g1_i1.p1  ORF type:complete len:510 (+),score=90.75 TRINITY_DN7920_c0_g1_i1:41-1570(+)
MRARKVLCNRSVLTLCRRHYRGFVLGYCSEGGLSRLGKTFKGLGEIIESSKRMTGKYGDTLFIPRINDTKVMVVGIGKEDTSINRGIGLNGPERIRRAVGKAISELKADGVDSIHIDPFTFSSPKHFAQEAAEGAFLGDFSVKFQSESGTQSTQGQEKEALAIEIESDEADVLKAWERGKVTASGQNFARMLTSYPANMITTEEFARLTEERLDKYASVECNIYDQDWLAKENMRCVLAVGQGSSSPSLFLEIDYSPPEITEKTPLNILVGKGVVFDTGGISIKPSANMGLMRADMGGAAVVVGTLAVAAELQLPVRLKGLIPLVENMPDGNAIRPGDIVQSRAGKYIEIDNTDAEGRLILADALDYACQFSPHSIIDIATLTGAVSVALGGEAVAGFTPSDDLWEELRLSGEKTGERLWRLPLFHEYYNKIKSDTADLRNTGLGGAGSSTAAMFLNQFVNISRWMHLDIAGVTKATAQGYNPKGVINPQPIRALVSWLENSTPKHSEF